MEKIKIKNFGKSKVFLPLPYILNKTFGKITSDDTALIRSGTLPQGARSRL